MLSIPTAKPHVNGTHQKSPENGHIEYSNGRTNSHAAPTLHDIEIELLAAMKHSRGVIQRVCKQSKPLTRAEFLDEAAGCIYGAAAHATRELGIATGADVIQTLEAWTREESELAPIATAGIELWQTLEKPTTAPDDAALHALDLAKRIKARGANAHDAKSSTRNAAPVEYSITKPRFQLLTAHQVKERPTPEYLIAGLLVKNTLAAVVAPSGTFKTFLALGIAGAIATGTAWNRREVNRAPVVYVSGEGSGGFRARIMAWEQHHSQQMDDCHFLTEAVQMLDPKEVGCFIEAINQLPEKPGLIILDTLARCIVGGDENSAKDMGEFVASADRVRGATGATVLIVHHTGKSGDTRGSTALPGAMDTIINVERRGDYLEVKCGKQKDAEEFATLSCSRRIIELVSGETSLILEPSEEAFVALHHGSSKKEETRNRVLEVLQMSADGFRAGEWSEAVENAGICKRRAFYGYRDDLQSDGKVAVSGGIYRVLETSGILGSAESAESAESANAPEMHQMHNGSEKCINEVHFSPSLEGKCTKCTNDECQEEIDVFDDD